MRRARRLVVEPPPTSWFSAKEVDDPHREIARMYVPELSVILDKIGIQKEDYGRLRAESSGTVTIPVKLFEFLFQVMLTQADFNETGYLASNPDVAAARTAGDVPNVRLHYLGDGYFEGRSGAAPEVDERWYLRAYPDVAGAVKARQVPSASAHFRTVGAREMRAPSEKFVVDAVQWGKLLAEK